MNSLVNDVIVKLDDTPIAYKSVDICRKKSDNDYQPDRIEITLTLWDGSIVYDDGSRVKILVGGYDE